MSPATRTPRSLINSAAWPWACAGCSMIRTSGPSQGICAVSAGRPVMRPNRSSGTSSAISGGNASAARAFQSAFDSRSRHEGRAAGRAVTGRFAELGVPEHVIPIRMGRKAGHHGLAELAKVVREAGHLGALIPGSMSSTPARPCTTTALFWSNSLWWASTPSATCVSMGSFRLWFAIASATVVATGGTLQALWAKRMSRGRTARSTPPSRCSAIAGACSFSATSSSETTAISGSCRPDQSRGSPRISSPTDSSDSSSQDSSAVRTRDPASERATA